MINKFSESDIQQTLNRLHKRGLISSNGTLKADINRKKDILMYMLFLWTNNKSKMHEIGNKRLSMKRIQELIIDHSQKTISQIIDDLNKRIVSENFVIKSFDHFTKVDYENMIAYLDDQLIKCRNNLKSYRNINIKPNVKFLTGDVVVPKDSVSITFTSKKIMEK